MVTAHADWWNHGAYSQKHIETERSDAKGATGSNHYGNQGAVGPPCRAIVVFLKNFLWVATTFLLKCNIIFFMITEKFSVPNFIRSVPAISSKYFRSKDKFLWLIDKPQRNPELTRER